jgi:hypothetical protein
MLVRSIHLIFATARDVYRTGLIKASSRNPSQQGDTIKPLGWTEENWLQCEKSDQSKYLQGL